MKEKSFNILLINPWIYDFAAYDFWAKPLGFLYVAALLRKNGFSIHYIDCLCSDHHSFPALSLRRKESGKGKFLKTKVEKPESLKTIPQKYNRYGIPSEVFHDLLRSSPQPDVILITSTMTYWYPGVFEVIKHARKVFPKTPIILGGVYATLCPGHAKAKSGADIVISGPDVSEVLKLVSSRAGKDLTFTPNPKCLDPFPYPAFDLYNHLPYVCILTSRGCPYRCLYCASQFVKSPVYFARSNRGCGRN